jgi:peptidoglycan/xylan/chitin deacetylase (PgdA/CDA1 family)
MRTAKRILAACLVKSGAIRVLRQLKGERHVILTFHRILPPGSRPLGFDSCPAIPADFFDDVVRFTKTRFDVVPLTDLVEKRKSKSRLAALTFDDGWRDNYDVAFPILKRLGLPATIFVTTSKIGGHEPFWQQELGRVFEAAVQQPTSTLDTVLKKTLGIPAHQILGKTHFKTTVLSWKGRSLATIDSEMKSLTSLVPKRHETARLFVNAPELLEMQEHGISIGSHSVNHKVLTLESPESLEVELRQSRLKLENILQRPVPYFSYPNGAHSPTVVEKAAECGYVVACTTGDRAIGAHDDVMRLPRIDVGWDRFRAGERGFDDAAFLAAL